METAKALPIPADKSIKWPKSGSAVDKRWRRRYGAVYRNAFRGLQAGQPRKGIHRGSQARHQGGRIRAHADHARQPAAGVRQVGGDDRPAKSKAWTRWTTPCCFSQTSCSTPGRRRLPVANLPARLLHEGDKPLFLLNGKTYELSSDRGYRNFWAIYHRPPEAEYRAYLLERRDSLLPLDERSFRARSIRRCTLWTRRTTCSRRRWAELAAELHRVGHVLRRRQSGSESIPITAMCS